MWWASRARKRSARLDRNRSLGLKRTRSLSPNSKPRAAFRWTRTQLDPRNTRPDLHNNSRAPRAPRPLRCAPLALRPRHRRP